MTSNGTPLSDSILPMGSESPNSRSTISVDSTATRAPVRASAAVNARPGYTSGALIEVHSAEYPSMLTPGSARSR